MRYWWAHYETGSPHPHFAWCNVCDHAIAFWSGPSGTVPTKGARLKIDGHLAEFDHPLLIPG